MFMHTGTLLILLLVVLLLGGIVPWGVPNPAPGDPRGLRFAHGYGYGPGVPGVLGLLLVVVVVLALLGHI